MNNESAEKNEKEIDSESISFAKTKLIDFVWVFCIISIESIVDQVMDETEKKSFFFMINFKWINLTLDYSFFLKKRISSSLFSKFTTNENSVNDGMRNILIHFNLEINIPGLRQWINTVCACVL